MRSGGARLGGLITVICLLVAGVPTATAQAQQLDLVTDLPEQDGHPVAMAGQPFQAQLLILDEARVPVPHHDITWNVTWNGEPWYRTTPASGHDYDGISTLQLTLPAQGPFTITATVPTGDDTLTAHLDGTVTEQSKQLTHPTVTVSTSASENDSTRIRYQLESGERSIPQTTYGLLEIVDDASDRSLLRVPTTISDTATETHYQPPNQDAEYRVHVEAWDPHAALHATPLAGEANHTSFSSTVDGATIPQSPPTEQPLTNRIDTTEQGPYSLHATYDPYTSVSTQGRIHLGLLLTNDTVPVPGADLSTRLTGPSGDTLLQTDALAAPTGVTEIVFASNTPGDYTLQTTARLGDWTGEITHRFSVHAPINPMAAGPVYAEAENLDKIEAAKTTEVLFHLRDQAGQPVDHSELDFAVFEATEDPAILRHKLHTHDSGSFPVHMTVPTSGNYSIRLDPVDLELTPVTAYYGPTEDTTPVFSFQAERSHVDENVDEETEASQDTFEVPAAGLAALMVSLLIGAMIVPRSG